MFGKRSFESLNMLVHQTASYRNTIPCHISEHILFKCFSSVYRWNATNKHFEKWKLLSEREHPSKSGEKLLEIHSPAATSRQFLRNIWLQHNVPGFAILFHLISIKSMECNWNMLAHKSILHSNYTIRVYLLHIKTHLLKIPTCVCGCIQHWAVNASIYSVHNAHHIKLLINWLDSHPIKWFKYPPNTLV